MNLEKLVSELNFLTPRPSRDGVPAFNCPPASLVKAARTLRDGYEFQALSDIASIDMGPDVAERRFGAVYHFFSHTKKRYIRLVSMCESAENPVLPSLCPVYKGADWLEREAFDLMGIVFDGHPNLKRILMWDAYPWHPLRKDFPLAGKDAPLPETFEGNENVTKVVPASENGGPFHSPSCGAEFCTEREPRSLDGQCGGADNV